MADNVTTFFFKSKKKKNFGKESDLDINGLIMFINGNTAICKSKKKAFLKYSFDGIILLYVKQYVNLSIVKSVTKV